MISGSYTQNIVVLCVWLIIPYDDGDFIQIFLSEHAIIFVLRSRFRANPAAMAAADDRQSSDSETENQTQSEGASQRENLKRDDSEAAVISAPSSPVIGKKRTIQSDSDDRWEGVLLNNSTLWRLEMGIFFYFKSFSYRFGN